MQNCIKLFQNVARPRKQFQQLFAHLRPLRPLSGEDEANTRLLRLLLAQDECILVQVCRVCGEKRPVEERGALLAKRVSQVREADLHARVDEVVGKRTDIGSQGRLVVGGQNQSVEAAVVQLVIEI